MPGPSKLLVMLLPAVGLLAACASDYPTVVTLPPSPPVENGALGAPIDPLAQRPLSGGTIAPAPMAMPAAPMRLSANEIAAVLANNTAEGLNANGQPYAVYFAGTGQERFRQGSFTDAGSWRVMPDGRLCSSLAQLSASNQECYILYRTGVNNVAFQRPDGTTVGTVTVIPGNPQNL